MLLFDLVQKVFKSRLCLTNKEDSKEISEKFICNYFVARKRNLTTRQWTKTSLNGLNMMSQTTAINILRY